MKVENSASHCEYYHCPVDHPSNPGQEAPYVANCEDIIQALGLTFDEGCEFKSLWRRGRGRQGFVKAESTALRDAAKAVHYSKRVYDFESRKAADILSEFGVSAVKGSRYPWPMAPSWAKWAATDRSGRAYWYEDKPDEKVAGWACTRHESLHAEIKRVSLQAEIRPGHTGRKPCNQWLKTLEKRP